MPSTMQLEPRQPRLLSSLEGHSDRVWQVTWLPKGMGLASCSGDKSIRIWRPLEPLRKTSQSTDSSEDTVPAWQWEPVHVLDNAHQRTIRSVSYSPNAKLLATASFDASCAIWDTSSSLGDAGDVECVATLEGHENEVKSVAWSGSGSLLATCSRDKSIWIWEVLGEDDFECISVLQEHSQDVKMVRWSPVEELLASASYDDTIKLWMDGDDDWVCASTLSGHTSTVWAIDFNSTGTMLASVSDDLSLRIWARVPSSGGYQQQQQWKCIAVSESHHDRVIYSVSWAKQDHGLILTAGGDNRIKISQLVHKAEDDTYEIVQLATLEEPHGHHDINYVEWCPLPEYKDIFVSTGDDKSIRLWQLQ